MSYELINRSNKLPLEISDYEYSRLPRKDQSKYKKIAGRSRKDDSDRSHVGTSSVSDFIVPPNDFSSTNISSSDDSFGGFGGGSGGGAGAGGSWDSDSGSSGDSSSYDSSSSDSGSSSSD